MEDTGGDKKAIKRIKTLFRGRYKCWEKKISTESQLKVKSYLFITRLSALCLF